MNRIIKIRSRYDVPTRIPFGFGSPIFISGCVELSSMPEISENAPKGKFIFWRTMGGIQDFKFKVVPLRNLDNVGL